MKHGFSCLMRPPLSAWVLHLLAWVLQDSACSNHALTAEQLLAQHAAAKLNAAGAQVAQAPPADDAEFVRALGTQLTLDGRAFRWVGANVYWLMVEASQGDWGKRNVASILDAIKDLGLTVVRTWAFGSGNQHSSSLHIGPGRMNENMARGLDYVVAEASKRSLRLILPLMGFWHDFGGLRVLQEWCIGHEARYWQPSGNECARFYSEPECRTLYLQHAQQLLQRVNSITGRVALAGILTRAVLI